VPADARGCRWQENLNRERASVRRSPRLPPRASAPLRVTVPCAFLVRAFEPLSTELTEPFASVKLEAR
jgi:hypothetical protein